MLGALRRRAAIGSEPWVSTQRSRQLTPREEEELLHPQASAESLTLLKKC